MKLRFNFQKKEDSTFETSSVEHQPDFVETVLKSYKGIQNQLAFTYGVQHPPFDPNKLLVFVDNNGYHSAAIHIKKSMIVGKGYDGDPELVTWLDNLRTELGLDTFFSEVATDMETFGYAFIEVVEGIGTWALYRAPAPLTRIKPPTDTTDLSYVQFNYVARESGELQMNAPKEFLPFELGTAGGIRAFKLPSIRGNYWYGEPEYVSSLRLLGMNISIVEYVLKIFKQGMMSDLLLIGKGTRLNKKTKSNLKTYLQTWFKGLDNAHKIGFVEIPEDADLRVERLNNSIDRSFSELRHDNRDEIVASHMMPPRIVGIIAAGAIGGAGEVEGQLKILKVSLIDPRQKLYESQFKQLFRDMGAPKWETFQFKPLDITAGSLDMQTLAAGVHEGILSAQEANDEWNTEKSKEGNAEKSAKGLIDQLRKLREELANG